jgi:hypothetical protein
MTTPNPNLLPLLDDNSELRDDLARYADLLDEIVAYGTTLLAHMITDNSTVATADVGTARAVSIAQIRWALELVGGAAAQVRAGWVDSASLPLRSLFEVSIGFQFMQCEPVHAVRKAYSYLICALHKRIYDLERHVPGTDRNKNFSASLRGDALMSKVSVSAKLGAIESELQKLREIAAGESYAVYKGEYNRTKKKASGAVEWYSLFDGPRNIYELAKVVNASAQYEVFYRYWSTVAHGADVVKEIVDAQADGLVGFCQLRRPHNVHELVSQTAQFTVLLLRCAAESLSPQQMGSVSAWYEGIRSEVMRPSRLRVLRD